MTSCANPSKKLAFIHIHKCAGTSITKALSGNPNAYASDWITPENSLEKSKKIMTENNGFLDSKFSAPRHFRAIDMRVFLKPDVYDSYYTFAVSRNPWDRLASWYFFLREQDDKTQSKIARQTTMEDFIKFSVDKFYLPQHQWVTNHDGDIIVDDIIKLEHLEEKWPAISARVFETPVELPKVNTSTNTTSPRPNPFNEVRTETLEMFVAAYERDFELLGYSKELPPHRSQNKLYKNCDEIWSAEVAGETDIRSLCKKYGVTQEFYTLYRETNSAQFYSAFLREQANVGAQDKLLGLMEQNKSLQDNNRDLQRELKVGLKAKEAKIQQLLTKISDGKKQINNGGKEKLLSLLDRNKSLQDKNRELRQDLKSGLAAKEKEIRNLRSEITDHKQKISRGAKDKILGLMEKNKNLQDKNQDLQRELKTGLAAKETKIRKLLSKIATDKNQVKPVAEEKLLKLKAMNKELEDKTRELRRDLKSGLAAKEKEIQNLRSEITSYKQKTSRAEKKKILGLMEKNKDLQDKNRDLQKKLKTGLKVKEEKIQKLLSRLSDEKI